MNEKLQLIDREDTGFSIARQCKLLEIPRSTFYYKPKETPEEDLLLMRRIDEIYTKYPFYGWRRIVATLQRDGWIVNSKRVKRLLGEMGIQAIIPYRNTSKANTAHPKFKYLLNEVKIVRPQQVWSTDITYIRLQNGFVYFTVVIDWFSRMILSKRLSNSLENSFCIEALEEALEGGKPLIFNTDQGVQYTSENFVNAVLSRGIQLSMDGKGRALDNVFVERFWRSLKYEEVYLWDYKNVAEARERIWKYCDFYNKERAHQALGYKTPFEIHMGV